MTEKKKGRVANEARPSNTTRQHAHDNPGGKNGQAAVPCKEDEHDFRFTEYSSANWWDVVPFFEEVPGQLYAVSECVNCNAFAVKPIGRDSAEVASEEHANG